MPVKVSLRKLAGTYSVSRLEATAVTPAWADGPGFSSISRSDDELSIVCLSERMPGDIRQDGGWACYKFIGPFAFDETGVVSAVIGPLSENRIGIFVVSTFDGDHLLIKEENIARAETILRVAGHSLV